jgi:hypothetical protein
MTFRAGQKVVCVDADGAYMLTLNGIYTISQIRLLRKQRWRGEVAEGHAIWLYEAKPEPQYSGFAAERFRPLVERPTDISLFQRILRGHDILVNDDA